MKFPLRLACLALLALSTTALAAEWLSLVDNPQVRMSLNPAGQKTADGRHIVQYRLDFKEPQKTPDGIAYRSTTVMAVIACKQKTIAGVNFAVHSEAGGKGKQVIGHKNDKPEPKAINGGSEELLWNAVCPKPNSSASPAPAATSPAAAPTSPSSAPSASPPSPPAKK
jgi:hypothetical protein